jgi:hypothetical protein
LSTGHCFDRKSAIWSSNICDEDDRGSPSAPPLSWRAFLCGRRRLTAICFRVSSGLPASDRAPHEARTQRRRPLDEPLRPVQQRTRWFDGGGRAASATAATRDVRACRPYEAVVRQNVSAVTSRVASTPEAKPQGCR